MNQKFKDKEKDEQEETLDFEIPDTRDLLKSADDARMELQREHVQMEEEEDDEKKKEREKKKRDMARRGVICICGRVGCGIGPMQEVRM